MVELISEMHCLNLAITISLGKQTLKKKEEMKEPKKEQRRKKEN